ncbi:MULTISPECIES: hypothetical protein [unclassified Rhizobacter]|uniref:hypothetical protein n=1 Tax=unclassified Rhizobacter TaxID=2640088 RepID=UPI0006F5094B|nr:MULTISPECIES: hypothetical protein [unclassified Rhizobacter]KQU80603.1 hypothetical protein ASC88_13550 [Rhizobacter sp. Root29]KQW09714.1 hypothetical protein ASC98_23750 [Rhizobacter sp. Root1238]KRB14742.1 hypothetical protein ASE08_10020 [Rhizobacter sp. Root16D2]
MAMGTIKQAAGLCASLALVAAAGCASTTRLDSQWSDPAAAPTSLQGAKVLVVCEADEAPLRQICQDQMRAEVTARGATAVAFDDADRNIAGTAASASRPTADYVGIARDRGATAVLRTRAMPSLSRPDSGVSLGFGLGTFGSGVGLGVGMSTPVGGGGNATVGYAAETSITDVRSGKLMWTGRATTAPSKEVNKQMAELATALLSGAQKAGWF